MTRPPLLMLVQRLPYPPNKGEKIRHYNMLKHLAESHDIYLGTLIDDSLDWENLDGLRPLVKEMKVIGIHKPLALAGMGLRWLGGTPLSFGFFHSGALQAWVNEVIERIKPDIAVLCSSNTAPYLIRSGYRPGCVIADFTDVDSQKWQDYVPTKAWPMKWVYQEEARRVRIEEIRIAKASDAVTFVSAEETQLFRNVCPSVADKAKAVSNGVDIDYFNPVYSAPSLLPDGPNFVFTGTMDYWPNVGAVTWFAEHVWPALKQKLPSAHFAIVGGRPSAVVQKLAAQQGIIVTGRIPDVRPYVAVACAVVAPLQIARGIQNKVLEGMAMGKAVITSTGALSGIAAVPGTHVLKADTADEWLAACMTMADDKPHAEQLGRAARQFVIDHFSWPAALQPLDDIITNTLLHRTNSHVSRVNI